QALDRVDGEAKTDQKADHPEQVAEHDRDVVFACLRGEVGQVLALDLIADEVAEEPATDAERDPGEHVEADQATPERCAHGHRAGGRLDGLDHAHPALLWGSGKYFFEYGSRLRVAGAYWSFCCAIQDANGARGTTLPLLYICPCHTRHSSAQRTSNASGPLVVTKAMLLTPGLASALTPSW